MAQAGITEKFRASNGPDVNKVLEHDFTVDLVVEGKISPENRYAGGVDHYAMMADARKVIRKLRDQNLKKILPDPGPGSSCNEAIALYFFKQLKDKYPLKFIRVSEDEKMYATVFAEDI